MTNVCFLFCIVVAHIVGVNAHGRLLEPAGRSSLWRLKDKDPMIIPFAENILPNYNDNALYCGGFSVQKANGGKCGVCGDNWADPNKPNEAGGMFARGVIARIYNRGQLIDVKVQITAEHKGYFEFRLCPWDDFKTPITHDCLNRHLLRFADGNTRWFLPPPPRAIGIHDLKVKLPDDAICETQCVLQWRYHTGNSWGTDENGVSGLGRGPQEEFYACSDIMIVDDDELEPTDGATTTSTQPPPMTTTTTQAPTTTRATTRTRRPTTTQTNQPITATPAKPPEIDCQSSYAFSPFYCLNCNQFYRCVAGHPKAFVFNCPAGTKCENGLCKHLYAIKQCGVNH